MKADFIYENVGGLTKNQTMSGQLNQQQFQTSNSTQAKQKSSKPNLGKRKVKKATNSYTDDNSRRLSLDQSNKAFEIADADQ